LMILSIALFYCGRNKYKKVAPQGNIVLLVGCAVGVCIIQYFILLNPPQSKE